jgi:hypothetical protein
MSDVGRVVDPGRHLGVRLPRFWNRLVCMSVKRLAFVKHHLRCPDEVLRGGLDFYAS